MAKMLICTSLISLTLKIYGTEDTIMKRFKSPNNVRIIILKKAPEMLRQRNHTPNREKSMFQPTKKGRKYHEKSGCSNTSLTRKCARKRERAAQALPSKDGNTLKMKDLESV